MSTRLEDQEIVRGGDLPSTERRLHVEPSPRRVRAYFSGVAVADSDRVLLVFEPKRLPVYWFPAQDVRMDLLRKTEGSSNGRSERERWDLELGGRVGENAAWSLREGEGPEQLRHHVAFYWNSLDAWFEEDDEVFVHPRSPYHRVDVLHSSREVRVEVEGTVVAHTRRPRLLFETGLPTRYYIPKQDVRMDLLEPSDTTTRCPYKGIASYWSVRIGERVHKDIVWGYPAPIPECSKIENLLSFYNEKLDIYVDGKKEDRPKTQWS